MLKPEYLQRVPDGMIKLYAQAEADILADMARRISTYDYWIPAVEHQANRQGAAAADAGGRHSGTENR